MTRAAVEAGTERFVDEILAETAEEFSVARALRGGLTGPGAGLVDRLLSNDGALWRQVVQPEFDARREDVLREFDLVFDYATADADLDAFADDLLAVDMFYRSLRPDVNPDRRAGLRERLLDRYRAIADALEPLLRSPESSFWDAVRAELTVEEAESVIETTFAFTDPVMSYRDAVAFETTFRPGEVLGGGLLTRGLPPVTVEYTDEAIRAMRRAERRVVHRTTDEVRRRFADPDPDSGPS